MISKIPMVSSAANFNDLCYAFMHAYDKSIPEEFRLALSQFTQSRYIYLTNSGISAFYIILKALKEKSPKREVILPAYTAGSLVVAVIKAGLKPVLCDISLEDFNLDINASSQAITQNTLAVVAVHMFGIVMKDIAGLRDKIPSDIFLIEDCAQSMRSKISQRYAGSFSDVSFFSFNRGKNLPLCGGGCIATNNEEMVRAIEKNIKNLKTETWFSNFFIPFKILAFSFGVNPYVYGLGNFFISCFKDTAPLRDFAVKKINNFQAGVGLALIKKTEKLFSQRYQNGIFLLNALKEVKEIILPQITLDSYPVFNRLPIIFKDLNKREMTEQGLWKNGIETSRMYSKPLHHLFNMGYKKESFPNAIYFAEHLLTLPVHPSVRPEDLVEMVKMVKSIY